MTGEEEKGRRLKDFLAKIAGVEGDWRYWLSVWVVDPAIT